MRIYKRILIFLNCIVIIFPILSDSFIKNVNCEINKVRQKPIIVDVVLYNFEDKYISMVRQNLEDIQKQNEGKVTFNFFDGRGNQAIQNEVIDSIVRDGSVDILLINLVNTQATQDVINLVKNRGIPIVFFNREPVAINPIKAYKKSYYVGTNAKEAGILQGKILIDLWNKDRNFIDKNNNGILEYILLQGERSSIEAQERTQFVIETMEKAGIRTRQLALKISNWQRDLARDAISKLFLQYGKQIEAIIANNDEMAIGAIEALQGYDYNKGDKAKTIAVVGVDANAEAQELIKNGFMTGTVVQNPALMANAIYTVGLNLFQGNDPLFGTEYKSDETGVALRLPYRELID